MNEYTIAFREWKTTPPAVRSAEASPFLIRDKPAILLETQLMQKSGRGRGTNAERAATRAQQRSERPGDPVVVLVPLTEDPRRLREVQSFSGVWRGQSGRQQTPRSSSTVCHELNAASSLRKCRRTRWPILPAAPSSSPRLRYSVKASARGDRAVGGTVPCPAVFSSRCLLLFPPRCSYSPSCTPRVCRVAAS